MAATAVNVTYFDKKQKMLSWREGSVPNFHCNWQRGNRMVYFRLPFVRVHWTDFKSGLTGKIGWSIEIIHRGKTVWTNGVNPWTTT